MNNVETDGSWNWEKERRVPVPKKIDELLVQQGDILFNATNSPELVGKTALVAQTSEPTTFSNHFIRLRVDEVRVSPAFAARYLQYERERGVFSNICKKWVNQASVSREDLLARKIPLPPLDEQRRIAGILDQADALRRLRTRALDKLGTLGQAIFHEMFGERQAGNEAWPRTQLSELVSPDDRINYGVVQPGSHDPEGVPIIRVADLTKPYIDFESVKRISPEIDAEYGRSRLKGGEILIGCVGSVGTTVIAPAEFEGANVARAVARVPLDSTLCEPKFVAEQLRSQKVQNYFTQEVRLVAQPTLNIKQIRETKIVLPPKQDQESFAKRTAEVDRKKVDFANALAASDRLFASLQSSAFKGEL
ncbi:restriction endonuclease subunit S [bacterium]|nr:restriction endonuclease subunit S [bacterium]